MADYSEDIASATQSIAEAGFVCQLSIDGTAIDVPTVLTSIDPLIVDGNLIRWTDRSALIPGGLSLNPSLEQAKMIIPDCDLYPGGDTVRIVSAKPTAPSGVAIIWELLLRK